MQKTWYEIIFISQISQKHHGNVYIISFDYFGQLKRHPYHLHGAGGQVEE